MKYCYYFLTGLIVSFFPARLVCADSPPPAAARSVVIFHEDFSACLPGQTGRDGYWSTSTAGSGTNILWEVSTFGALEPRNLFLGRGDYPWEGEWRSETIDISPYDDVEVSIDVYSDIYSRPPDRCWVQLSYQIDTGDPVVWFSHTGDLSPRQRFIRKTSPPLQGESLVVIFRAATELAMGEEYLFRDIRVTGTRPAPAEDE